MTTDIKNRAMTYPQQAKALAIKDENGYYRGADLLQSIKGLRAEVDKTFDPVIKSAHAAHKTAVAAKKDVEAPLAEAEAIIKRAMLVYSDEQKRIIEAEARAALEAKKAQDVAEATAAGDTNKAQVLAAIPVRLDNVELDAPTPQVDGVQIKTAWKAEVIGIASFVVWCAQDPTRAEMYLEVRLPELNALARVRKSEDLGIPGIRGVKVDTVSAKGY